MIVKDGILKLQQNKHGEINQVIVLNGFLTKELVHLIHTQEGSEHLGIEKTKNVFNSYFYCPGAHKYIEKYITTCKACVDGKRLEKGRPALGRTSSLPYPRLKYWSLDLCQLPK